MKMPSLLSRNSTSLPGISGTARIDRDTAKVLRRAGRGDVVILDEIDLDRKTADALIRAQVLAVVNASPSISGRYPNLGPQQLVDAGIILVDEVGSEIFREVKDGAKVRLYEGEVFLGEKSVALGVQLFEEEIKDLLTTAKQSLADHLEAFSGNTVEFIRTESPLLIDGIGIPDIDVELADRQVLVVDAGPDYKDALKQVKPFIKEYQPILIGVNGGADALFKAGFKPDLIVGDPESMSSETLRCGAQVVLPADPDGHAKGLERIQDLGVGAMTFPAAGTPADLALLLAYHHGASLIATVGVSASLSEFFDRDKSESAPSMFLTRLRVGEKLVDGRALATLYRSRVSVTAIALFVLALMAAALVVLLIVNGIEDPLSWAIDTWNRFALWVQGLIRDLRG
ncbi:putative cytokinetic ring protein SteA [Hoyosella subflava]|uniref:Thiamin pyrophosphokinase n=1 Tax=Hoyosella subflava (strain DSM 45089 / JCM 17490 / NBRC 109087 / DQS3-9A1) TaxID=443218 RepID=F6EI29_HOYSD|nr:putative cytokinetic ring protein SteA [Hoyosella subflava]AEF39978.1 Thiamin pyrophosphokinase [Hoyosella subflava DQS3-9A1]